MKKISLKFVFLIMCSLALIYLLMNRFSNNNDNLKSRKFYAVESTVKENEEPSTIVISFVVCGSRFNESINVVKSALIFSRAKLHFVIFTDDILWDQFDKRMRLWQESLSTLSFELHKINFPEEHREDWLNLFSKCAAQRLFIPKLLPHLTAMIYVDTDTLFLGPVEDLWDYFNKFNSSQISAMALEDDNPNVSWYPRFAKHPFYGKYGLNSGVMLMNLTRMRNFGWTDYVTPIMLEWKMYIPWGDQDIINVIFHYHPRAVLVLSCRYNYRSDQCMYGDACADATARGIFLLHGSRRAFHSNKQPAFQAIYRAIEEFELGDDPSTLIPKMEQYLSNATPSNCGHLKHAFLRVPSESLGTYPVPNR